MKKFVSLLLALMLVVSVSTVAFAAHDDSHKDVSSPTRIFAMLGTANPGGDHKCHSDFLEDDTQVDFLCLIEDFDDLNTEEAAAVAQAQKALAKAAPEGMVCQYLCYVRLFVGSLDVNFDFPGADECAVMMFVDGAWENVPVTANGNQNFTMTLTSSGPIAFFSK